MPRKPPTTLSTFINGFLDLDAAQREAVLEVCTILHKRNGATIPYVPGEIDGNIAPAPAKKVARRRRRTRAEIAAMEAGDPGQAETVGETVQE